MIVKSEQKDIEELFVIIIDGASAYKGITKVRNKGIGSQLLKQLCDMTATPILIGTWAEAKWAIQFYQKHGFRLVSEDEKNKLLRTYWTIPVRQIETSVVLASADWEGE